jgi:hypothetical protein
MKFDFKQALEDPPLLGCPCLILSASSGHSKARNGSKFERKLKVKSSFEQQENVAS